MGMTTEQLLRETRITFTELAKERDVATQTIWRWASRGIKGHVLESFSFGNRKCTTREAFERWIAAINGRAIPSRTNNHVAAAQRASDKLLNEAGLLPA